MSPQPDLHCWSPGQAGEASEHPKYGMKWSQPGLHTQLKLAGVLTQETPRVSPHWSRPVSSLDTVSCLRYSWQPHLLSWS